MPQRAGRHGCLASSLVIYFNTQNGLDPKTAGFFTAGCVFAGLLMRPIGGNVADRVGGFYLASSLGYSKQRSGSYQAGFLIFAALAIFALVGLTSVKIRWRTPWGASHLTVARI